MTRHALDRYDTIDDVARRCIAVLPPLLATGPLVEPSAGGGSFTRALLSGYMGRQVVAVDIDPEAPALRLDGATPHVGDWLQWRAGIVAGVGYRGRPALVAGNPPYRDALDHIEHALAVVQRQDGTRGTVAMLLRLGFLASRKRAAFWGNYPPAVVHVLSARPSFTGDGKTDATEYAWYVWTPTPGPTRLAWLP